MKVKFKATPDGEVAIVPRAEYERLKALEQEVEEDSGTARLIARAALRRTESRGGHYRSDFPQRDDIHWRIHVVDRAR